MNPKISVIVPVYNVEKFLTRCIDSILAQTFTDFELLLIDDGSKDKSGEICDEYAAKDSRIRVFHKQNGGVSTARNLGIDKAQGEWVYFVDSDDWIEIETLSIVQSIDMRKIGIIKFGYYEDFYDGKINIVSDNNERIISDPEEMLNAVGNNKYYGFLWNSFFNRSIIKTLRFDEDLPWMEDHIFSLQLFLSGKSLIILSGKYYHYNIRNLISLSSISDPIVILKAANREFEVNKLIIKSLSSKVYQRTLISYHGKIRQMILSIFNTFPNFAQRKKFYEEAVINDKNYFSYVEKIYFMRCPYIIKDLMLYFYIKIRTILKK